MNSLPVLSAGCLERIIGNSATSDGPLERPLVQILASKRAVNGFRVLVFDGINTYKNVFLKKSPQMDAKYDDNQMDNYSVVRLEEYWVSTVGDNDVEVVIVSDVTTVLRGSRINRKLESCSSMSTSTVADTIDAMTGVDMDLVYSQKTEKRIDVSKVCPISAITPFFNGWVIRARITSKTPIRTYNKEGREIKVFSFEATDESSDIKITAFNAECDKYHHLIEKDLVYYICKGTVKTANKRFANSRSDYEISLTSHSMVDLCHESVPVPRLQFKFVPIAQLVTQTVGASVDVLGVITRVEELQSGVGKKSGKEYTKRDICLLDKTLAEVRLTFWNTEAEEFSAAEGQVLAVKNAVVGDFKGRTLSYVLNSVHEIDPDLTTAHILKGWYDRESIAGIKDVMPLSKDENLSFDSKYLCEINQKSIPEGSQVFYYSRVTIMATNPSDKHFYKSCSIKGCLKKVREENGFYFCEKCHNNSTQFQWRLMLSLCCADSTADVWVTAFQEVAERIVGKTVAELIALYESDPNQYQSLIAGLTFKSFVFRMGSKVEEYNNERRVKSTCHSIKAIDPIERSKELIRGIRMWTK